MSELDNLFEAEKKPKDDLDSLFSSEKISKPTASKFESFISGVNSSVPGADYVNAAADYLSDKVKGNGDFAYKDYVKANEKKRLEGNEANPITSALGNVGGTVAMAPLAELGVAKSLASLPSLAKYVPGASGLASKIKAAYNESPLARNIINNTTLGAIQGSASPDENGALEGVATGAILTPALHGVGKLFKNAPKAIGDFLNSGRASKEEVARAIENPGAIKAARPIYDESGENILEGIRSTGEELSAKAREGSGKAFEALKDFEASGGKIKLKDISSPLKAVINDPLNRLSESGMSLAHEVKKRLSLLSPLADKKTGNIKASDIKTYLQKLDDDAKAAFDAKNKSGGYDLSGKHEGIIEARSLINNALKKAVGEADSPYSGIMKEVAANTRPAAAIEKLSDSQLAGLLAKIKAGKPLTSSDPAELLSQIKGRTGQDIVRELKDRAIAEKFASTKAIGSREVNQGAAGGLMGGGLMGAGLSLMGAGPGVEKLTGWDSSGTLTTLAGLGATIAGFRSGKGGGKSAQKLYAIQGQVNKIAENMSSRMPQYANVILNAAKKGPQALMVAHVALAQKDPEYKTAFQITRPEDVAQQ